MKLVNSVLIINNIWSYSNHLMRRLSLYLDVWILLSISISIIKQFITYMPHEVFGHWKIDTLYNLNIWQKVFYLVWNWWAAISLNLSMSHHAPVCLTLLILTAVCSAYACFQGVTHTHTHTHTLSESKRALVEKVQGFISTASCFLQHETNTLKFTDATRKIFRPKFKINAFEWHIKFPSVMVIQLEHKLIMHMC